MRVYKAMRSSGIPTKALRHAIMMGAVEGYCASHVMTKWCQDLQLHDIMDREHDPRGHFHACLDRWCNSVNQFGLAEIVGQSELTTWIDAGLTTEVMIAGLPVIREKPYDLAAYLVLLRQLNLMEYWATVGPKNHKVYRRLLRLRGFWVNPENGYGPFLHRDLANPASRYRDPDALYPMGLSTVDLISFQPSGMDIPIIVPVKEPVQTVSNHVLVLVPDVEKFMPFINSRWLDEYGA